jgi:creatinine amidohydrolase
MGIEGPVYQFYCENKRRLPDLDIRIWGDQVGWEIGKMAAESGIGNPNEVHAGGVETSMALATNPDLVHLDRLAKPAKQRRNWSGNWWIMEELSESGATGDPTRYDAEFGKRLCSRMDELFCDFLGEMWKWQAQ